MGGRGLFCLRFSFSRWNSNGKHTTAHCWLLAWRPSHSWKLGHLHEWVSCSSQCHLWKRAQTPGDITLQAPTCQRELFSTTPVIQCKFRISADPWSPHPGGDRRTTTHKCPSTSLPLVAGAFETMMHEPQPLLASFPICKMEQADPMPARWPQGSTLHLQG